TVQAVAERRGGIVNHAANAVDSTERLVYRQGVPRRVRKVFAESLLLGAVEALRWNCNRRNLDERRKLFAPEDGRVVDRHGGRIGLALHHEQKAACTGSETGIHG